MLSKRKKFFSKFETALMHGTYNQGFGENWSTHFCNAKTMGIDTPVTIDTPVIKNDTPVPIDTPVSIDNPVSTYAPVRIDTPVSKTTPWPMPNQLVHNTHEASHTFGISKPSPRSMLCASVNLLM